MDPSEQGRRSASFSASSDNARSPSESLQNQQQSAGDINVSGEEHTLALVNAAGDVTLDQSQQTTIQIEASAVGSSIISGDGNIIYVVHQATEQQSIKAPSTAAAEVGPNPYRGLAAFQENNADQYFGREVQVKRLWQRFQRLYERSTQASSSNLVPRLLPILGPSGSGKSSLARAGLIPELARHPLPEKAQMRIAVLVPGTHPVEALAGVLAKAATQDAMPVAKTREFATELMLKNKAGCYDGMRRIADLMPQIHEMPLIVLVDQFEEVYSLCKSVDERVAFIENLLYAASSPTGHVSVVLTLRSDFLGETQRHQLLNQVICSDRSVIVPVMTEAELRRAIAEPAKQAGHPLDAATVNLLVKDTKGREGALPLLQFALTRIWAGLSERKAPAETYEEMGGVGGALAGKAQEIYDELDDAEQDMVRRVFIGLVQLGEGTRDTRRRAAISSLMASRDTPEAMKQVIHRFSSPGARLVTLSSQAGLEIAEVTHEALFDHWQLLNDWLDSSRDDIRFQRRLDAAADYWKEQGCPEGSLWRRPDLDLLKNYHRQASQEMTPLQLRFFRASMRADRRRKVMGGIGVGALVVLSGATSLLAISAQRTKRVSQAIQLATKAEWIGSQRAALRTTSALLAVKSFKTFENDLRVPLEVDQALRSGLKLLPVFKKQLNHADWVYSANFSPDGQTIVTASKDNTARLWNTETGEEIATLNHADWVYFANFSPNGKTIVTASEDNAARLWNTETGEEIATLNHADWISAANFSPDGQIIVTASGDNTARLWKTETGEKITTFNHDTPVRSASFSPDGRAILTSSDDNIVQLWNAETGEEITTFNHETLVRSANFSPDGQTIFTVSGNIIRRWNAETAEKLATFNHAQAPVRSVNSSPDGQTIITASDDNIIRLWAAETGEEITSFNHEATVQSARFNPDGQIIVTVSEDNIAQLWNAETGEEIITLNHEATVRSVNFSPDGQTIVTVSEDNIARLWNAKAGQEIDNKSWDRFAGFSPDGKKIITRSEDSTFQLWNAETGQEITILNHETPVKFAGFSPDGKRIITRSEDSTFQLWNAETSQEIATFNHEISAMPVIFSPDSKRIVTRSEYNTVRIWSAETGQEITIFNHETPIRFAGFSPDGKRIITRSEDSTFQLWNAETGQKIITVADKVGPWPPKFSPDSQAVVTASEYNTVRLWNAETGQGIATFSHEAPVMSVIFSPDSKRIVTRSRNNTTRLWNAETGQKISTFNHNALDRFVIFSSDSKRIVTRSENRTSQSNIARLWNAETGQEIATFNHADWVRDAIFSPDGQTIVTSSEDSTARLWNAETGQEIATFNHADWVRDAIFSPDGQTVVTASEDNTARLWNAGTGQEIATFNHGKPVWDVSFSPDGQTVVTVSESNAARLWVLSHKNLFQKICEKISRNLTASEWSTYLKTDLEQYELTCSTRPVHPSVLEQARQYARSEDKSDTQKAIAIYKRVKDLHSKHNHEVDLDPSTPEKEQDPKAVARKHLQTAKAESKIQEATRLATDGKIEEATILYQAAQEFSPEIDLDPNTEIQDSDPKETAMKITAEAKAEDSQK